MASGAADLAAAGMSPDQGVNEDVESAVVPVCRICEQKVCVLFGADTRPWLGKTLPGKYILSSVAPSFLAGERTIRGQDSLPWNGGDNKTAMCMVE
jgi:hypothetical protein